jgi:hypothetical protein
LTGYIPPQSIPGNNIQKKKKKAKSKGGPSILEKMLSPSLDILFNPGKQADTLAEAIEKQAAAQMRAARQKEAASAAQIDPFQALQEQLFSAVNGINIQPTPIEQLRAMAEGQVDSQFDPVINALKNEVNTKKGRAKRSQGEAREMYGALAQDYLSQLPQLKEEFAAEDSAANQRYDQAQAQMESEYQQNAKEQNALLKQLGIQAAAPDASQQMMEDRAYFQNQMEMDQQANLSALNQQQNAQQDYQRNLGNTAKMAGENLAQDIGQQLADYLSGAESQMTQLVGQKSSAMEALLAQLQQQDSQRASQAQQQEFDNMMKLFNFQLATQKAMMEGQENQPSGGSTMFGAPGTLTTGLAGAQNYLAGQYPDQPILASGLMEQINDVLSNKEVTRGKFVLDPGDPSMGKAPKYSDVGQEYMIDLLRREFEKEGDRYSSGDINATINALLAYLGKLR